MKIQGIATRYGMGANVAPILSNESKSGQRFKSKFQLFKDRRITSVRKFHKGRKIAKGLEFSNKFISKTSLKLNYIANHKKRAKFASDEVAKNTQKMSAQMYMYKRMLKQGKVANFEEFLNYHSTPKKPKTEPIRTESISAINRRLFDA